MFRGPPPDLSRFHSVLVNNLVEGITPEDLNDLFKVYGEIGDIYIPRERGGHYGYKNFGFVRYLSKESAGAALAADGVELLGNKIGVQEAKYGRRDRERRDSAYSRGYLRGHDREYDRDYVRDYDRDYDRYERNRYEDSRRYDRDYYGGRRARDYHHRSYSHSPLGQRSRSPPPSRYQG